MGKDAAAALTAGLSAANYPAALKKTGAFVQKTLIELAELVQAYNYGVKPVIVGTAAALANVLPDSSLGYRGIWDAAAGSVRLMKDFFGFELVELSQFAAGATPADGLALADNVLYVISPALEKLVQGAVSMDMTNTNNHFDNADITQNYTHRKNWGFEFAGAAWAGQYTITA